MGSLSLAEVWASSDTTWTRRGWNRVCTVTPGTTSPTCSLNTCPCKPHDTERERHTSRLCTRTLIWTTAVFGKLGRRILEIGSGQMFLGRKRGSIFLDLVFVTNYLKSLKCNWFEQRTKTFYSSCRSTKSTDPWSDFKTSTGVSAAGTGVWCEMYSYSIIRYLGFFAH